MTKKHSNSVVFPFKPFTNLENITIRDNFIRDTVYSIESLRAMFKKNELANIPMHGKTVEEKIFSFFLHPNVRFGPLDVIAVDRNDWLKRLSYFTSKKKPIVFTLLGFPGKAPVPLKTNRTLPDCGEVMALRRLRDIMESIERVYAPGARIVIVTEGALGKFIGLSGVETGKYEHRLAQLSRLLQWGKNLSFIPIGKLRNRRGFDRLFRDEKRAFAQAYENGETEIKRKYDLSSPSIFHLMNVRDFSIKTIAHIYAGKTTTTAEKILERRIDRKTKTAVIEYLAFLSVRDKMHFLDAIAPHALPLTVSPKRGRLGIHLINAHTDILAHHGVVCDGKTTYLLDVRRSKKPIERVFLKGDPEQLPFFYRTYKQK